MKFMIKSAEPKDEHFLWQMLYEAAHMDEAGEPVEVAKHNPALARYVAHWGQEHDVGYIAIDPDTGQMVAAAWFRLLHGANKGYGYVSDKVPELAIGARPAYRGQGAGTVLMEALIQHARGTYAGLSLSVRDSNPAVQLYERLGFQRVPGSEMVNRVGGYSVTMVLNLE
jgi:GNAT superfamily N-acetyltransferase